MTEVARKEQIRVTKVTHKVTSPRDRASGLPTGRRQHKPVYIQARIDRSTPQFFNALANNETITDLKLQFWRPERTGKEVLAYTMELVNASVAEMTISTDEMQRPSVSIGFTYEKIIWTWTLDAIMAEDGWMTPVSSSAPKAGRPKPSPKPSPKASKPKANAPRSRAKKRGKKRSRTKK